ncbi:MAG: T9SS type A sorting domain-containing protein, partial [Bacteroidetes bacterium]|nr:T9SS type A sorting domain-containing protein [Bacteroidota bacterium]
GTPTVVSAAAIYTVTANNSGGSTSFGVSITVNDIAPSSLSYPSPIIVHVDEVMTDLWPTVSGFVTHYGIEPQLPEGLTFDVLTGQISGTPTQISPMTVYTITAYNSGGSASFELTLTVDESMSVDDSNWQNLMVYPNPFVDFVRVDGMSSGQYKLYSIEGKRIREGILTGQNIDLSGLPSGSYLLQLSQENRSKAFKLIKR